MTRTNPNFFYKIHIYNCFILFERKSNRTFPIQIQLVYTQYEHDSTYNHVKQLWLSLTSIADALVVKYFQSKIILTALKGSLYVTS